MESKTIKTGLLNNSIDLDKIRACIEVHDLRNEILKFKPRQKNRKGFMNAYVLFLSHKDKLDLSKFGFIKEKVVSDTFGEKVFFKPKVNNFFYSELFEAIHLGLL